MRLLEACEGTAPWRQWGPYLIERQWGTLSVEQRSRSGIGTTRPCRPEASRSGHWSSAAFFCLAERDVPGAQLSIKSLAQAHFLRVLKHTLKAEWPTVSPKSRRPKPAAFVSLSGPDR